MIMWDQFAKTVRATAANEGLSLSAAARALDISHARFMAAAQGKPVGTDIFLTICAWIEQDAHWYWRAASVVLETTGEGNG